MMARTAEMAAVMTRLRPVALMLALSVTCGSTAHAQVQVADATTALPMAAPMPAPVFSFSLTGASDYLFRGVSQTENHPAIFGGTKVSYDHFYLAAGAENVDFHNGIDAEYDLSGGWARSFHRFDFDVGVVRYGYHGGPAGISIDTTEIHAGVTHIIGPIKLGGAVYHAFDYFGTKLAATYVEATATYTMTPRLTASGLIGRQGIDAGHSFTTWSLGGGYALTKHIAIGLRYVDTDGHAFGNLYRSHFVGSIGIGF